MFSLFIVRLFLPFLDFLFLLKESQLTHAFAMKTILNRKTIFLKCDGEYFSQSGFEVLCVGRHRNEVISPRPLRLPTA